MVSLLLMTFKQNLMRNFNLGVLQEFVLIIKMHMLSMQLSQLCTWYEPSWYMLHFIGLNMVLMIWHSGHLLSSILPGCIVRYLAEQQDLLHLNCSLRLMLIIKIFSELMFEDVLPLFWTLSIKMVRNFKNGINVLR